MIFLWKNKKKMQILREKNNEYEISICIFGRIMYNVYNVMKYEYAYIYEGGL